MAFRQGSIPGPMSHKDLLDLDELLRDAAACTRLTDWEESFLSDVRERRLMFANGLLLSDKQKEILARIRDQKVYP